ncbi:FAD-dependent oxidoreductase [Sphingomonas sp. SUN039]|uniref:FAD-dependent oxidoreductase n=1 Tax=Sphingomonas sp. SUN039 TaxID=2937787 RepID=UPI0021647652|nr:FAD-dependent oxidoreductase [Sphingomonas sp. SUN039]UVO54280.1 FAD-dependent oxidoreductase [Sphingomonas sp. SUN039]
MAGFDETFDWVVVGSGAGSMASALVMRAAGKSVLIVEKTPFIGGTTAKSGGVIWVPNNRFLKADEPDESAEKAITYLDAVCEDLPGSSHEKRVAYVAEAPKMVDFLIAQGIALERGSNFWPDYYDDAPGGCSTSRTVVAKPFNKKELGAWEGKLRQGFMHMKVKLDDGMKFAYLGKSRAIAWSFLKTGVGMTMGKLLGQHWVAAGAALQGRMLQASLKAGVELRTDCPVTELIVEDGKVTGVVMPQGRIGARLGVLVNAGGYAQNQAMRDKYMPGTRAEWSNTPEGDTGDLHAEMERIGGVLAQMDQMVGYQLTTMPGWDRGYVKPPAQGMTGKPHAILVDQSGVRYMNEGGSYELYCQTMRERNAIAPAIPSWAIFDATYAKRYPVGGVKMKKYYAMWKSAGYLKEAASPEDLAVQIGCDPATLRATLDRWNGFVDAGHDADFHRGARKYDQWLGDPFHGPNPALGRIDTGPFYAVEVVPGDVSTYGGAVTDAHGRVVRADGTPIEGLYACGVSTASVMGGVYPGAGASIGPSLTFGYVAAKHAAGVGNRL